MAQRQAVHAQLVRSAGDGNQMQQTGKWPPLYYTENRVGRLANVPIDFLFWAIGPVANHGERNFARVGLDLVLYQCGISLMNLASLKLVPEVLLAGMAERK